MTSIINQAIDDQVLACLWSMLPRGEVVTASLRDIEERTLISRGTIARSLQRLRDAGDIQLLPSSRSLNAANRYRLLRSATAVASPVWSRRGLGPAAYVVHEVMRADEPMTVREIAARTGLSTSTVRTALERLVSAGLSEQDESRRYVRRDDQEYMDWYAQWLVGDALESTSRKIRRERFMWNKLVAPTQRGPLAEAG